MSDDNTDPFEAKVNGLLGTFARSRNGSLPRDLHLGQTLDELREWLDDERQWRYGEPQHWKALLADVRRCLSQLLALSEGVLQHQIKDLLAMFRALDAGFKTEREVPDESLRRRLRRATATANEIAHDPSLLPVAWRRITVWSAASDPRADRALGTLRDVIALRGNDGEELMETMRDVLNGHEWTIARLVERDPPGKPLTSSGLTASDRLALAESVLTRPAQQAAAVVWLEYLPARLQWPYVLRIGPSVTLYCETFLRAIIHQVPNDERVPPELRDLDGSDLPIWLDADDPDEAVLADRTVTGDPRVFVRIELDKMPAAGVLDAARETADFLTAYASLFGANHETWQLGPSYFIVGRISSTHAFSFDEIAARDALEQDMTATHLVRNAAVLGGSLPLRDAQLRIAGRLLIWLRRASATDNPAQLVLCERVIEQICGWAGISKPQRFIADYLRPSWVYQQILHEIKDSYWNFWSAIRGNHVLQERIEIDKGGWSAGGGQLMPTINLVRVLETLSDLVEALPESAAARVRLARLHGRTTDREAMRAWLDELFAEFDRRNARLRRTRNALMHGGPIVSGTVDNVSVFAATLAHYALGTAIKLLLTGSDIIDGFLDQQLQQSLCLEKLRDGTPASEVLFVPASDDTADP